MLKQQIKDFYGRIVGTIDTDNYGNKIVYDAYSRKLGSYDKRTNTTRDFYNRIISKGDVCASLIDINFFERKTK